MVLMILYLKSCTNCLVSSLFGCSGPQLYCSGSHSAVGKRIFSPSLCFSGLLTLTMNRYRHQSQSSNLSPSHLQECPSTQDLLSSLRQVEKMLAVHEASYQQGLRAIRKKISALHNSTVAIFKTAKNGEK